jgi:uncharacterized membrane protein YfcA
MHEILIIIKSFISSFDTFGLILIVSLTLIGSIVAGMSGYGAGILIGVVLIPMVGIKKIIPIVTILTFYINFWRIILYWDHINWKKSLYFSIFAAPGLYFSTYFFSIASTKTLTLIVGFSIFALVVLRKFFLNLDIYLNNQFLAVYAIFTGLSLGVILGPGLMILTGLSASGLNGSNLVGTSSVADLITLTIRSIHFYKLGIIDLEIFTIGSFLGIMCLFGTYLGKKIVDRIGKKIHQNLIEFFMISGSIIMIVRAITLD